MPPCRISRSPSCSPPAPGGPRAAPPHGALAPARLGGHEHQPLEAPRAARSAASWSTRNANSTCTTICFTRNDPDRRSAPPSPSAAPRVVRPSPSDGICSPTWPHTTAALAKGCGTRLGEGAGRSSPERSGPQGRHGPHALLEKRTGSGRPLPQAGACRQRERPAVLGGTRRRARHRSLGQGDPGGSS